MRVTSFLGYLAILILGWTTMVVSLALGPWDGGGALLLVVLFSLGALLWFARHVGRPYLRRSSVAAVVAAPFVVALIGLGVISVLDLLGAHCPGGGLDYISECNDLAGISMVVFLDGIYVVGLAAVVAIGVLIAAAVKQLRRRAATPAKPAEV